MTTSPSEYDWSALVAGVIAGEVRRYRRLRGLSAQQLADRCEELGLPFQRSVVANLESGRRQTVSVAELLVLSRVLEVPPVTLIFPVGWTDSSEILPGVIVEPLDAAKYMNGQGLPPGADRDRYQDHPIYDYRKHEGIVFDIDRGLDLLSKAQMENSEAIRDWSEVRADEARLEAERQALDARYETLMVQLEQHSVDYRELEQVMAEQDSLRKRARPGRDKKWRLDFTTERLAEREARLAEKVGRLVELRNKMEDAGYVLPGLSERIASVVARYNSVFRSASAGDEELKEIEER